MALLMLHPHNRQLHVMAVEVEGLFADTGRQMFCQRFLFNEGLMGFEGRGDLRVRRVGDRDVIC